MTVERKQREASGPKAAPPMTLAAKRATEEGRRRRREGTGRVWRCAGGGAGTRRRVGAEATRLVNSCVGGLSWDSAESVGPRR
jgi:hypothetical protein